jgi:hypothetical protein
VLGGCEVEVPGGGFVELGLAELAEVADEAGGFGFDVGVRRGGSFASE